MSYWEYLIRVFASINLLEILGVIVVLWFAVGFFTIFGLTISRHNLRWLWLLIPWILGAIFLLSLGDWLEYIS